VLRWEDLDLLAHMVPDGVLPADHRRLASFAPADLTRITTAVPPRQAAALIATLDAARAAALATLDSARNARILEHTAPVAAATPAPLASTAPP
jgi:acyl CoA:acetate/3-ketoacid CoA transferase